MDGDPGLVAEGLGETGADTPVGASAPAPAPLRASIYVVGVTADGRGVGPTRVPRQDVVRAMDHLKRSGYLPLAYVGTHPEPLDGDFLAVPDAANAVALP